MFLSSSTHVTATHSTSFHTHTTTEHPTDLPLFLPPSPFFPLSLPQQLPFRFSHFFFLLSIFFGSRSGMVGRWWVFGVPATDGLIFA
ncbi:hypothetical protein Sjap_006408 [Stephania japonica]|uniref:Uncharacterized protein n=1 Tax=Stephania japonica TaxID=461633 RepID=A0AAP0K8C3_9MAGN